MTKFAERKKKWGQEMVFGSLSLPANIIKKLRLLRTLYTDAYGRSVSYGEIIERLLSSIGLGSVDPTVYARYQLAMSQQTELDDLVIKMTTRNDTANYDPAAPEMEPWNLNFYFTKDGEEVDAIPGNSSPFYAVINGINIGYRQMRHDGWKLINDVGAEIDYDAACEINKAIKQNEIKK